ncbi:MAG: FAD:protein FMN transferase [Pseudomonadota bacterium]
MLEILRFQFTILVCFAFIIAGSCRPTDTTLTYTGNTMGTTYNVVAIAPPDTPSKNLGEAIEATLERVNAHLSNWDPKSEISRFNALQSTDPARVSNMMVEVLSAANAVNQDSDGHFDVTLAPVIELWGFGERKPEDPLPHNSALAVARTKVGQSTKLSLDAASETLTKIDPDVTINLSAIAKGFGVDEVAATLRKFSIENYMVEIGGDLVTRGIKANGENWRIGIEKPNPRDRSIQLILDLSGYGMATSGDYRNYREHDGKRYSHIIDVKTGRPITHQTASVTVLAESAMLADAWATALLAVGRERGMRMAKERDIAAFFIYRASDVATDGDKIRFSTLMSPRFEAITVGN